VNIAPMNTAGQIVPASFSGRAVRHLCSSSDLHRLGQLPEHKPDCGRGNRRLDGSTKHAPGNGTDRKSSPATHLRRGDATDAQIRRLV